jgi:hypothetical protein
MASLEYTMHEAAVRALSQQEAALEALRARTGNVLTAASVIASFLGGQAIARNGLDAWVVLALGAFALVVLLCVYTLLPRRLIFWVDTEAAYSLLLPKASDERLIDQALARLHHDLRSLNEPMIARLGLVTQFGALGLIVEIALLGGALA